MPNLAVLNRAALNAPGAGRLIPLAGATAASALSGAAGLNVIVGVSGSATAALSATASLERGRILGATATVSLEGVATLRRSTQMVGDPTFITINGVLKPELVVDLSGAVTFSVDGVIAPGSVILGGQPGAIALSANTPTPEIIHPISGAATIAISPSELGNPGITTLLGGTASIDVEGLAQLSSYDNSAAIQYKDVNASDSISLASNTAALDVSARMAGSSSVSLQGAHGGQFNRVRKVSSIPTTVRLVPDENVRLGTERVIVPGLAAVAGVSGTATLQRITRLSSAAVSTTLSANPAFLRGDVTMAANDSFGLDGTAEAPLHRKGLSGAGVLTLVGESVLDEAVNLAGDVLIAVTTNLPECRLAERLAAVPTAIIMDAEAYIRPAERFGGAVTAAIDGETTTLRATRPLAGSAAVGLAAAGELDKAENLAGAASVAIEGSDIGLKIAEKLAGAATVALEGLPFSIGVRANMTAVATLGLDGSAGMVPNPFAQAPIARRVVVPAKLRTILVEPKRRTIRLTPDDRGIIVDIFEKQPTEVVDYDIDMTEWFETLTGDEIVSAVATVSPAGLDLGPGALQPTAIFGNPPHFVKVWVGAGDSGIKYKVTVVVETSTGRVEEVDFIVKVRNA